MRHNTEQKTGVRQMILKNVRRFALLLLIVTLAMFIECLIFQFPALRYKEKPLEFLPGEQDDSMTITTEDDLAELSAEEIRSIEVERDNNRLLAEYNGEEYVEPEDGTLVEENGTMYRKVKRTTISIALAEPYYIHKLDLRAPVTESAGYSVSLYKDGVLRNDNIYCSLEPKTGAGIANVSEYADEIQISILSREELAPSQMKITLSNSFRPNAMRIFFMVVCFVMIAMLVMEKKLVLEKPEWMFAICCLLLGSLIICGIGTNQVSYDEYVHAKAAYNLSFGTTIERTESALQMSGNLLPYFNNPEERALVEAYEDANNDYSWADIGHQSRFVRSETRVYYPMAVGFWLGRVLRLSFADTVALAKFGNLLFYIIIVFWAIRLAGRYKNLTALIALLPNCVFLAASLTYDAVVNSFLLLGMVLVMNEILEPDKKLTWYNTLLILISFAIGCQSKPIYVVMVLLLLFCGKKKFENRLQEWICKAAVLCMACLMVYNIFRPTPSAGSDYLLVGDFSFAGDKRNLGTSVTGQIQYIFEKPWTYTVLLLSSMLRMTVSYLTGASDFFQYGYVGEAPTICTYIVLALALWLALTSAKGTRQKSMGIGYIVLTILMIFGVSAIVWTSMYVSYTTVGASEIRGVQGRYFIPMFLPALVCLLNGKWESRLHELTRNRILFAVMSGLNLFMIYAFIIQAMNV